MVIWIFPGFLMMAGGLASGATIGGVSDHPGFL
jgi:hypothetical protein